MAPVPLRVYDPSVGALPQSVKLFQTVISTESSSFDFETTPEQAAVKKDVATTSKGKAPMTSEKVPSWLPKRAPSKVELLSKYRYQMRSLRIRDQIGVAAKNPDYVPETVTLLEGESDKNEEPVTPSVATKTPQPTPKSPPKSSAKEKNVAPKQKAKKSKKKRLPKKFSKR